MQYKTESTAASQADVTRPLARQVARELTPAEVDIIAGGKGDHTHATGANGDDPADPGV